MPHSACNETQCKIRGAKSEPDQRCAGIGLAGSWVCADCAKSLVDDRAGRSNL